MVLPTHSIIVTEQDMDELRSMSRRVKARPIGEHRRGRCKVNWTEIFKPVDHTMCADELAGVVIDIDLNVVKSISREPRSKRCSRGAN